MCQTSQVAMKRRRDGDSVEAVTKRAKQIALNEDEAPNSPIDVASELEDVSATSESSVDFEELAPCEDFATEDLNLEVKLMQGAVNEMQATVNFASARISELRALLMEYAELR